VPKWYRQGVPTLWLRIRNLAEELVNFVTLGTFPTILKPEVTDTVDAHWIYKRLHEEIPTLTRVLLSDEKYQLPTKDCIIKFLSLDDTDKRKYVPIWYDCDDFSFRLMGQFHRGNWACLAIGIAWSSTHAYNIFIDSLGTVYVIEPQTDVIIDHYSAARDSEYATTFVIM